MTAAFFMPFGFGLMLLIRWELAYPAEPVPAVRSIVSDDSEFFPGGIMAPEFYNSLGAMHGTIMVFLAVVPFLVGAFGNYLVPLRTFFLHALPGLWAGRSIQATKRLRSDWSPARP